jgi:hypothetical protein
MQRFKTIELKVPIWISKKRLLYDLERIIKADSNYVSAGSLRRKFGISRLKSKIKISKKEEKSISEFRTKEAGRAHYA